MFQGHPSIDDMVVSATTMMDKQNDGIEAQDAENRGDASERPPSVGGILNHLQSARSKIWLHSRYIALRPVKGYCGRRATLR